MLSRGCFSFILLLFLFLPVFATQNHYVDSSICSQCHQKEYQQWKNSHHHQSMQVADQKTVLGNFDNATFTYYGQVTTFINKDGKYFINTLGDDGKRKNYEVKYTFGVDPLQQYLVQLQNGRLQAFTVAWDVKNKKWFHLYPNENILPNDPLHWTKRHFNWNHNCAECHSTNLKKNYNPKTKKYHTKWSEISVGCQACHGPGKQHVKWAKAKSTGKKTRIKNKGFQQSIAMCSACHSRRHRVSANDETNSPLLDHFMPELLRQDLYHPDGQIKEEVYVLGSFLQSKMHKAGVQCKNCHNPHSVTLKKKGNQLCLQCHNTKPAKRFKRLQAKNYHSTSHHHHKIGSKGALCVSCHMPGKMYMQIDFRRDHSFRIPRPDLTEKIGTPNACNQCHSDKSSKWASKKIEQWYGTKNHTKHYGEIFDSAHKKQQTAEVDLIRLSKNVHQPIIVRATAIDLLAQYPNSASINARKKALIDKNALLRATAVTSLAQLPLQLRQQLLLSSVNDPIRAVRVEAARALSSIPLKAIPAKYRSAFQKAFKEYKSVQETNLDLPESHFNLGLVYQEQGEVHKSIQFYRAAIESDKHFIPAQHNFAMLLNAIGRKKEAENVLRKAIAHNEEQGELYYSLGLLLAEQGQFNHVIPLLEKAASLLPNNERVHYNYGLALQHLGDLTKAEIELSKAHKINPKDVDVLYALTILHVRQHKLRQALKYAKNLEVLVPNSARVKKLIQAIEARLGK